MTKKVLIIDSNADLRALYQHVRPQYAPDLELMTVGTTEEALAALATAPVDTIVLAASGCDDGDKDTRRYHKLQKACPTAECFIFNTRGLASDDSDMARFYRLFSISANNISHLYPRLGDLNTIKRRRAKVC
jgi:hypothetical protein